MTKPRKKISYEQDLALYHGRRTARANQRRRTAAKQEAEKLAAERAEAERNHAHGWKNWDYVLNHTHEVRECRDCGYAEIRPVRL
jgi:hypothetical protein